MVSLPTSGFRAPSQVDSPMFGQIQAETLAVRLWREVSRAAADIASNPVGVIRAWFVPDWRDPLSRKRFYYGAAFGLAAYAALTTVLVVIGLRHHAPPADHDQVVMLGPIAPPKVDTPPAKVETDLPKGSPGGGGGGGGQNNPRPATKGVLPQMAPLPQIVNINPNTVAKPSLPTPSTIVGPLGDPPPPQPLGVPNGAQGPFSGGPGSGGGVGKGQGTGIGSGKGPGAGPGSDGGTGGRKLGLPNGTGPAQSLTGADYNKIKSQAGFINVQWIHKPVVIVTPEAIQNQVEGVVLIRATFRADATLDDIELVNGVDFMTESALRELKQCKWKPATFNGVPITVKNELVKIEVKVVGAR